jgi:hypothetical protein
MNPIPVAGYLVPEHSTLVPDGFTRVDEPMTRGLPHIISLDRSTKVTFVLPSGLARAWRNAESADLVSASDEQHAPAVSDPLQPEGDVARPPIRLLIERGGQVLGAVALAAGLRQVVPNDGGVARGAAIELVVLGWTLRAGTVRGPGDFGSRITLAWRLADRGSNEFAPPPINPNLARRLAQTGGQTTGRRR